MNVNAAEVVVAAERMEEKVAVVADRLKTKNPASDRRGFCSI